MKGKDEIKSVEDEAGRIYKLIGNPIEGGQGAVRMVEGGRFAVKILSSTCSEDERRRLQRQLAFVKRLPLENIPISRPERLLRDPWLGYVMELLSEMEPIEKLAIPPGQVASVRDWYTQTGSLRRRLRVLARCARVLAQLHGKGLVYSDLNPLNVLVSTDARFDETWLVDVDNLSVVTSPLFKYIRSGGYSAPEVIASRKPVNSTTDAFSFAVIAFEVLTLVHPYVGDQVEQGEVELLDAAYEGRLPWVDDPDDRSNAADRGIERSYVFSGRLRSLMQSALGSGRTEWHSRPSASAWAEALDRAADRTLECLACKGTYYQDSSTCPWCAEPRARYGQLKVKVVSPDLDHVESAPVAQMSFGIPSQFWLTGRVVTGREDLFAYRPMINIRVESGQVWVAAVDEQVAYMIHPDGWRKEKVTQTLRPYSQTWQLHLGPLDCQHRFVTFSFPEAA